MIHPQHETRTPLIALISGVPAAITPATQAIQATLPHAIIWNILDDRLISDADDAGGVSAELEARMNRLIDHATVGRADAVLITCSLYAHLGGTTRRGVPILGSDDAAFAAVLSAAPERVLLISSVELALHDSTRRLRDAADTRGVPLAIEPIYLPGALEPSRDGNTDHVARLILEQLHPDHLATDVILFAQYTLSPAAPMVAEGLPIPVIAPPTAAAQSLATALSRTSIPTPESEMN